MPAKFVVQMRVHSNELKRGLRAELDSSEPKLSHRVWLDTLWPSLAAAQEKWPEREYREVMTQW